MEEVLRNVAKGLKQLVPLGWRKIGKIGRARLFEGVGSHRYSYPALDRLDIEMATVLPDIGVFLEVGANDGYSFSNTYYLERVRGWSGILIEPLPSLYELCRRHRTRSYCVRAACVATATVGDSLNLVDLDLMSVGLGQQDPEEERSRVPGSGGRRVRVPARTLSQIIDDSPFDRIDFMSIDVEGAELSLLAGLDLNRYAPRWLLIETAHPTKVAAELDPYLRFSKQLSRHDYLFVRNSER